MGGCFGSHPIDRWLESQVDEYTDGHKRPLSLSERRAMQEYDLTEDEIREGIFHDSKTDDI